MAQRDPASQENEQIGRAAPLAVMLAVIVFSTLLCLVAYLALSQRVRTHTHALTSTVAVRPEPEVSHVRMQLLEQPGAGQQLQARQRRALQGYGWVDQARGIVRIPIDLAIQLELEQKERP